MFFLDQVGVLGPLAEVTVAGEVVDPQWMDRVFADDLPALLSLVNGMKRDLDAVTAGLSTPWSSGQVEGHVTRAKLLKRMGFGRANLDLLRRRILLRT
ncbi:transposase [Streptomyces sp. NBC_01613]|uniref:transposase n=1 Tax=Streptomyces sp. NBC_01613 TaxID=2975896 RepID=UPI003869C723